MVTIADLLNQVEDSYQDIISLQQNLVRIPSVNTGFMPTGNETPVCEFASDWLGKNGITSEILESAPGRGNLIARLPGDSHNAGLLFMSHTDVVPVEDDHKWRFAPFSATIAEGRIFGRGASDCKGLLTAQLMAMNILNRNGVKLKDSLLLASGADEEHGGRYGFGWLADNYPEKIAAPFAVNEGGGNAIDTGDGGFTYILGVGEKGRLQVEIDIKGSSSHASVPWQGTNALYGLAQTLKSIELYEPERDTSASLFEHLSTFAIEDKPSPETIDDIILQLENKNVRLASILKALSRMTLTPTIVKGGVKSNSVPEAIRLTCDVRTLPHQDDEYLVKELAQVLEGIPGISYEIDYMAKPNASPFETSFAKHIQSATATALGMDSVSMVPGISTGFTDSRFTRPLGTITYGFSAMHPEDDPMISFVHGTNESIGINSLINSTKVMVILAHNMLAN